jgi:transposase-like protein
MPPADEVMASYEQIGSISGLADHYGVPRHTAQGWARQLRRHGHAIGRTG